MNVSDDDDDGNASANEDEYQAHLDQYLRNEERRKKRLMALARQTLETQTASARPPQSPPLPARAAIYARLRERLLDKIEAAMSNVTALSRGIDAYEMTYDGEPLYESAFYVRVDAIMAMAGAAIGGCSRWSSAVTGDNLFEYSLAAACSRPPWPPLVNGGGQQRAYTVDALIDHWTQRFGIVLTAVVPCAPSGLVLFFFEWIGETDLREHKEGVAIVVVTQLCPKDRATVVNTLFDLKDRPLGPHPIADTIAGSLLHEGGLGAAYGTPSEITPDGAAYFHTHAQLEYLTFAYVNADFITNFIHSVH